MSVQALLTPVPATSDYKLLEAYKYQWTDRKGATYRIVVPVEFHFSASIPRVAWSALGLTPGHPKVLSGACLHDYLYRNDVRAEILLPGREGEQWTPCKDLVTRKQADKLLLRIMRETGTKRYKRRLTYRALRLFGGGSWRGA